MSAVSAYAWVVREPTASHFGYGLRHSVPVEARVETRQAKARRKQRRLRTAKPLYAAYATSGKRL